MFSARRAGGALTLAQQLLVAVVGALLVAALIALHTSLLTAWPAWGLLLGPAIACAVLLGVARSAGLIPGRRRALAFLKQEGATRRLSVWVLAACAGWFLAGRLALWVFERWSASPTRAGTLGALLVLGLLLAVSWLAEVATRRLLGSPAVGRVRGALGLWRLLVPPVLLALGVALPIALGETAGRGHAFALMGVFRRPELDLRAVLDLAGLGLGALIAGGLPYGARRALGRIGPVLLGLAVWSAVSTRELEARQATDLTRGGGLSQVMLGVLTSLSDRDHDGAAKYFGGGDCDDQDRLVFPGAAELPGNGRDEDCDGEDAVPAPPPPEAERPLAALPQRFWPEATNVLLLTVDTLRFDLGYAMPGRAGRLSPRLDELAKRCTVFERAYSLASYTSKSLGPMLIGKYSSETARSFEHFDRFGKSESFLQERVQQAGHLTASVQAYWYFFLKGYGFERGFDRLDHEAAPQQIAVDGDASVTGEKLGDRVIDQLASLDQHTGRFFVWAHWVDPHSEYVPHAEFDLGASPRERYDGEVAYVDHQIGRVLDALAAKPYADRTAILITSDHGEAFGEHGMIRHGFELWEELVRVPLLICVPGSPGQRVTVPRSLIDLAPTVLELLDVPTKPGELSGLSLVSDLTSTAPPSRPILVDMPRGPNNQERRAFLAGDHKLITSAGRVIGLYDLSVDPWETHDLSADQSLVDRLQVEFKAYLSNLELVAPG